MMPQAPHPAPTSPSACATDARQRARDSATPLRGASRSALVPIARVVAIAAMLALTRASASVAADPAAPPASPHSPSPGPATAWGGPDGSRHGLQEWGLKLGYGTSKQGQTEVMPIYAQAGWSFFDAVDQPLKRAHFILNYVVEGWLAGIHTPRSDSFELGINPVTFKLAYDRGQQFVPFFQAGVGVMYTALQDGLNLGGPFEFDEVFGGGLDLFCTRDFALSISYRFRHISNAGLSDENSGLDTHFVLLGFNLQPGR